MAETESIVLEHLRAIRQRVDDVAGDMREMKGRMSSLERHMALTQTDIAELRHTLDRQGERLSRIEKRLDLTDAPAE